MARDGRETTREPGEAGEDGGSTVGEAGAELGSLFAQLRVSHRVAVWRADVRQGLAYLSVLDLPEEADPTWLLEHIRAQYGPGRYKLRPVGPSGKYQPGQATISLADDRRVSNPGSLADLLALVRQPSPTGHASAPASAPVAQHDDTTRLLLGAFLEGQGGERELLRSLLLRQTDPTAELVKQAEHFRRLRNIFAPEAHNEPEAPASNALGSPGMDQWLMQMLMGGMMGGGGMAGMMPPGMMPPGMMPPGMMPPGMMPPGAAPMNGPPSQPQRPPAAPAPASQPVSTPPPAAAQQGDPLAQVLALLHKLDGEVASLRKEVADLQYEEGEPSGDVVEFPSVPGMDLAGMARQFLSTQTGGSNG